jgi:hypothetical protein
VHNCFLLCTATRTQNYTRWSSKVRHFSTGENVSDRRIVAIFRVEMCCFFPWQWRRTASEPSVPVQNNPHGVAHQKFVISKAVSSLRIYSSWGTTGIPNWQLTPSDSTDLSRPLNSDLLLFWQFHCRVPPQAESPYSQQNYLTWLTHLHRKLITSTRTISQYTDVTSTFFPSCKRREFPSL